MILRTSALGHWAVVALLLLAVLLLTGCQSAVEESSALPVTVTASSPTKPTSTVAPTAVSTIQPPPPPTALSTATMQPTPLPTERPLVTVFAPQSWRRRLELAFHKLAESGTDSRWQQALDASLADIQVRPDDLGIIVGTSPIAIAVPFTTDWHATNLQEARQVMQEGHQVAKAMDWSELTPDKRALRIDGHHPTDPGYPLRQPWSLHHPSALEAAAVQLGQALQLQPALGPVVHLAAVGDIMLDRSLGNAIRQGNLDYPFGQVRDWLEPADLTVGNLESSLGDTGQPAEKRYTFQAPPAAAAALARAGFDIVSLANNHAMDYGPGGLTQAMQLLESAGVTPVGAGLNDQRARQPQFVEVKGIRLAFLAYVNVPIEAGGFDTLDWTATSDSAGLAWGDPATIGADVRLASEAADVVIVLLHSGFEYIEEPSQAQAQAAQAAIDAGADLVIGHHAHVLQGVDFYNDGVIAYGLGNFAFQIEGDPASAILNVWLDHDGVRQLELLPAVVQFGGQPRMAEDWEASPILRRVYFLTNILNVP